MNSLFSSIEAQESFSALVQSGNISMLDRHFALGRRIAFRSQWGNGLHLAAVHGLLDVVMWFLDHGMDVNLPGNAFLPFGFLAAERGYFDVLRLYVDCGGDRCWLDSIGLNDLQTSIYLGNSDAEIIAIIELHSDQLPEQHTNFDIGDSMITAKSSNFDFQAIHVAAHFGRLNVVKALVDAGADPNATSSKELTPFLLAAQRNHFDIMRYFISIGVNVNARSSFGENAAHFAAALGNVELLVWLESIGVDMDVVLDRGSILLCAIQGNQYECCRWMIEDGGYHHLLDAFSETSLRAAFLCQSVPLVRLLSSHGARISNPAVFACRCFHTGLLDMCLEEGFFPEDSTFVGLMPILARDWNALDWLVSHGFFSWVPNVFLLFRLELDVTIEVLHELKRRGYDFHVVNEKQQNLFFVTSSPIFCEFLMEEGIDPDAIDLSGDRAYSRDSLVSVLCFFVLIGAFPGSIPFELFPHYVRFLSADSLPDDIDIWNRTNDSKMEVAASLRVLAMHAILQRDKSLIDIIYHQYPMALWLAAAVTPNGANVLHAFEIEIDFAKLESILEVMRLTYLANRCSLLKLHPSFMVEHFEIL